MNGRKILPIDEQTGRRVCDNVREYLAEQVAKHPGIETTDSWRQEWEAEWVILTSSLIYRFTDRNVGAMPTRDYLDSARYVLGLDLGYNDPTAITVVAYNTRYSNKLHVVYTFQQQAMLVADVAEKLKELEARFRPDHMVGDSSSLQVFETLRQQYGLVIRRLSDRGSSRISTW